MTRELQRYLITNQLVHIIYLDQKGSITQRRLRLHSIEDKTLKAFCFTKRSLRSFLIENILAVFPDTIRKAV